MTTASSMFTDALEELREKLKTLVPPDAKISKIEFEGPFVVLYSLKPEALIEDGNIVRELARKLQKRIVIRSDSKVRKEQDEAIAIINQIVPEDAQITTIHFDETLGEVIIEAKKPGLVIGKNGANLHEISKLTGWRPNVMRTPPIESQIISSIRKILKENVNQRKFSLIQIGKRIHRPKMVDEDNRWVRITGLGGCGEVGRSALLLETPESRVLVDIGVNVGAQRPNNMFPHLDSPEFDLENLDAVVITHAHLDHSGFLPYLFKYGYRGPVYVTDATLTLMTLLQRDYIQVAQAEGKLAPYSYNDIKQAVLHSIPRNYNEVTDLSNDIKLTFTPAGHILGSAVCHFHIGEGTYNVAITGDFKYAQSRLLEPANTKFARLETLVMESTYGAPNDIMPPRQDSERQIIRIINATLKRGGKVLIPTLAVGRAQELLLIIEQYIRKKKIVEAPVYIDGMIWEATAIHTCYPELLAKSIRDRILSNGENPFLSEYFINVEGRSVREEIIEGGPAIILATSGMLTGGASVQYFYRLCSDPKNSICFVSYQAEGTLGRRIAQGAREVRVFDDGKVKLLKVKMDVHTIEGFSGHSDRRELIEYVRKVQPQPERVILVHGNYQKSLSLASALKKNFRSMSVVVPRNLETIRLN